MRQYIILLFTSFTTISLSAQVHTEADGHNHGTTVISQNNGSEDVLRFLESEFDFAKIPQGKPAYHTFELVNTGKIPMKLENVAASCGCTTPEWSRDPIEAGATAKIKVGFNAAAEGVFDKTITVTYNNGQTKQLRIKGYVWRTPPGPAPANASIDLLKKQSF